MEKRLVKELYEGGDRKRKIALARVYRDLLFLDVSLKFICERINRDLGFNLVTENDIKYIRHHFKPGTAKPEPRNVPVPAPAAKPTPAGTDELTWTNPEEIPSTQSNLKSKFTT